MPRNKKFYTLKYLLSKLKGQKCWKKISEGVTEDLSFESGWRRNYWFQFTPSITTPINKHQVMLKIEEGTSRVEFTVRHLSPSCLRHQYFFDVECQEDIENLSIVALQMKKLSQFNFGGTPEEFKTRF